MKEDPLWQSYGVTGAFLEERAAWLSEKRKLHGVCLRFFEEAGLLVSFSRFHYRLGSVAFFHAIPGLERALRQHYEDESTSLSDLLLRAWTENWIHDSLFQQRRPFEREFSRTVKRLTGAKTATYSELLVRLIPKLRNEYFHENFLLAPDYVHLTFQLREIADVLETGFRWPGQPKATPPSPHATSRDSHR